MRVTAVLFAAVVLICGCGREGVMLSASRTQMGTLVAITAVAPTEEVARRALEAGFAEVARVEAVMSLHDPDSDLSRMNAEASGGTATVSDEMMALLEEALGYCEATGGAFDITIGPVVRAWGFHRLDGRMMGAEDVAALMPTVGWDKLRLDPAAGTVSFDVPGMEVDLGAIAKGYAADRAAEAMVA
ncbi:unnamed protein product, partial [marine sediment metagenome]